MVRKLEYLYKDRVVSRISYDPDARQVISVWNDAGVHRCFWLIKDGDSYDRFIQKLSYRILPEERYIRNVELQQLCGSVKYDPLNICHFTHGAQVTNFSWIRFDDDDPSLCWDDVKMRDD